jgi:hypothetical protein
MAIATRPKPKTHHKKRQAQHHKQSKQYLKAYWPYIPVAALTASAVTLQQFDSGNRPAGRALSDETVTTGASLFGYQPSNSMLIAVALITAAALLAFAFRQQQTAKK